MGLLASRTKVAGWQLASGHFIAAKMAPTIIAPRADVDTTAWERHRRAPSTSTWTYPVGVQGGAWPFHYEIVSGGGSGVTIGEDYGDVDYGVMKITSPAVGTYSISIKVTDQDTTAVTRDFTLEVIDRDNTTYFLWLDATSGSDSNAGTFTAPKQTLNGWYLTTHTDTTHTGKQVHYKAGTYTPTGITAVGSSSQQITLRTAKPLVHVALHEDVVIFDLGNVVYFILESTVTPGGYWGGIDFVNPRVNEGGNARKTFLRNETHKDRFTVFRCSFDGGGDTSSVSGSNSAAIGLLGTSPSNYTYVCECTFNDCDNMDTVLMYECNLLTIERCEVTGSYGGTFNPSWGMFIKGGEHDHVTVRANTMIGASKIRPLVHMSEFTQELKTNIEVCWNNGRAEHDTNRASGTVALGQGVSGTLNSYGPFWSYRNNWYVHHFEPTALQDGPFTFENECIQCNTTYLATYGFNEVDNAQATMVYTSPAATDSGMFDGTTNLLTGASRTTYLGTHGCEVF